MNKSHSGHASGRFTKRQGEPGKEAFLQICWESARLGKPFDYKTLDKMPEVYAHNYEQIRLMVISLKAAGLDVPAWPRWDRASAAVDAAFSLALQMNKQSRESGAGGNYPIGKTGWQKPEENLTFKTPFVKEFAR